MQFGIAERHLTSHDRLNEFQPECSCAMFRMNTQKHKILVFSINESYKQF